jgi:hypothetical protein
MDDNDSRRAPAAFNEEAAKDEPPQKATPRYCKTNVVSFLPAPFGHPGAPFGPAGRRVVPHRAGELTPHSRAVLRLSARERGSADKRNCAQGYRKAVAFRTSPGVRTYVQPVKTFPNFTAVYCPVLFQGSTSSLVVVASDWSKKNESSAALAPAPAPTPSPSPAADSSLYQLPVTGASTQCVPVGSSAQPLLYYDGAANANAPVACMGSSFRFCRPCSTRRHSNMDSRNS